MNIYVGNLAPEVGEVELTALFKTFGEVRSVHVMRELFTGVSKGFAFIEMPGRAHSMSAITGLNGKELLGKPMRVNEAQPRGRSSGRSR